MVKESRQSLLKRQAELRQNLKKIKAVAPHNRNKNKNVRLILELNQEIQFIEAKILTGTAATNNSNNITTTKAANVAAANNNDDTNHKEYDKDSGDKDSGDNSSDDYGYESDEEEDYENYDQEELREYYSLKNKLKTTAAPSSPISSSASSSSSSSSSVATDKTTFVQRDMCSYCLVDLYKTDSESHTVCPQCYRSQQILNTTHDNLGNEEVDNAQESGYECVKYYIKWLTPFRAGTPPVPDEVMNFVWTEYQQRYHDRSRKAFKASPIKTILRGSKYSKYCLYATIIAYRFCDIPIANLNYREFNNFVQRFHMIQQPHLLLKDRNRKNISSFSVCTRMFAQMENALHFLSCFPRLKIKKTQYDIETVLLNIGSMLEAQRKNKNDMHWIGSRSV